MEVNTDTVKDGSTSIEIVNSGEISESNNIDSLEVISSSGDIALQIRTAAEVLTKIELDLACSSEKLVNLDLLVMYVEEREYDFEAFILKEESTLEDSDEKALEFDLLSGILDSEVKELDNFLTSLQTEILSSQGVISVFEQFGEAFKGMEEKLYDCEECLKQSFERVTEKRAQSSRFQRILLTSGSDENWKDNKEVVSFENGDLLHQNTKIKMKTVEEQRKILQMLEKSLARELELEKKLSEFTQTEEDLNIKLQQEVYCIEEEVEVTLERLFESENTAEILLGISKELLGRVQILQFNLNASIQREEGLKSKLQDLNEQLKDKECALQNCESTRSELVEKATSLQQKLKDFESHLQTVKDSSDKNEELSAKIHETENIIDQLKEKAYDAEQRSESAEAECKLLRESNVELNKDLCILKSSLSSSDERVEELERKLKDSEIKQEHAVAFAEASQEKQNMLDCMVKDMENLIENLKSKVSKAESSAENAEEKCIILSESNADLVERINFLTSRTEDLEASLYQAEEAKKKTAKDIGVHTKFIADLVVQLALERERLHKQIISLVKEKRLEVKHLPEMCVDPTITTTVNSKGNTKESMLSENDSRNATSAEESNEQTTESLDTSHEMGNKLGDATTSETNMERADSTELETNLLQFLSPMEELSNINRLRHREQLPQTQQTSLRPNSSTTTRAYQETEHEEDELNRDSSFLLDFDSLEPHSNSNSYFFIPDEYNASSNFGFNFNAEPDSWVCEYSDSLPDRNCRLCREGYDEPMNFVTDLFESREAQILDDPIREFDSGLSEDTRMEFGFGPGLGSDSIPLELGIRVEGSNAESDFGEFDVNSGFIVNDDDNYESFGVNEYRIIENQREEFEWEEVSERNQFDERENFDSVIDRIGGVLVSSNVPSPEGENSFLDVAEGELEEDDAEEEERNVEWEVLMTANNLDSDFGFENQEEYNNDREFARFDLPDDYTLTMEQWVENENAVKIGLPASKSVVENLPSVVLTVDEVQKNNDSVVCAVCKEDVAAGEKITRMPCFHLYHGDCILPWLEIRNTCPVCRYELPTDDADYEKRQRDSRLGW